MWTVVAKYDSYRAYVIRGYTKKNIYSCSLYLLCRQVG